MHGAEARGELPSGTAARWESHTPKMKLPERIHKKVAECPDWVAKVASLSAVLPQSAPAITINPQPQLTKSTVPVPQTPIRGYVPAQFRQGGLFGNRGIKSLAMNVGMASGALGQTHKLGEATPLPPPHKANWSDDFVNNSRVGNFSLIPPVAGAGIGGLLGFMKSKRDGAGARGAVTAAGAGLGAGTALSLGNSFLQTPVGEAMRKEQGLLTMLGLLGVGAAGAHFGIQGGRGLADKLGLPAYNRTHGSEDDLTELDPATHASLLPGSLKKLLQTR